MKPQDAPFEAAERRLLKKFETEFRKLVHRYEDLELHDLAEASIDILRSIDESGFA